MTIEILKMLMLASVASFSAYTFISLSYFYNRDKIRIPYLIMIAMLIMGFIIVSSMVMVKLDELKRLLE